MAGIHVQTVQVQNVTTKVDGLAFCPELPKKAKKRPAAMKEVGAPGAGSKKRVKKITHTYKLKICTVRKQMHPKLRVPAQVMSIKNIREATFEPLMILIAILSAIPRTLVVKDVPQWKVLTKTITTGAGLEMSPASP